MLTGLEGLTLQPVLPYLSRQSCLALPRMYAPQGVNQYLQMMICGHSSAQHIGSLEQE